MRARLLVCWAVLAAAVPAQDEGFDAEKLLKEAQARLEQVAKPETQEQKAWSVAVQKRIALLEEWKQTQADKQKIRKRDEFPKRRKDAEAGIAKLQAASAPETPFLWTPEEAATFKKELEDARTAHDEKKAELERIKTRHDALVAERKDLPKRAARAKRAEDAKPANDLDRYRVENARLESRVIAERKEYLDAAIDALKAYEPVLQIETRLAGLRAERAKAVNELAIKEAARMREQAGEDELEHAKAARKLAETAKKNKQPIEAFRQTILAETWTVRARVKVLQNELANIQSRKTAVLERAAYWQEERERLDRRLKLQGAAKLLNESLDRARQSEHDNLQAKRGLERGIAEADQDLAEVLDRIWALRAPPEQNKVLGGLLAQVPKSETRTAERAYTEVVRGLKADEGLVTALRAKQSVLESIEAQYGEMLAAHNQLAEELGGVISFVLSRIYWLQSDEPLGADVFGRVVRELRKLLKQDAALWTAVVLVAAFLIFVGPRMRRLRRFLAPRAVERPGVWDVVLTVLLAGTIPAVALVASAVLNRYDMPDHLEALPRLLRFIALLVFARSLAFRTLDHKGLGPRWGMNAAVAHQILRSIRIVTMAALFFWAPGVILKDPPFNLVALPRLLDTAWVFCFALSLYLMMHRRGAIIQHWTRPDGFPRRFWRACGPILGLLLVTGVVMDIAGYRVGAFKLIQSAGRTAIAFLALALLYRLLVAGVNWIATLVRKRVVTTEGAAAAWESATAVVQELTRLVAILISVAAVWALLRFWNVDRMAVSVLQSVEILKDTAGNAVTLWDVAVALLWIVGAHIVVHNLSALYEFLVFPLIGGTDRGGRFVVLALSRYAILLVAYSAALVTMHFSFTSIGWLLTAVSVGLGFGLQEIVANFVSGLILLLERPIRVGDIVTVGTEGGTVERIQIRATTITNWDRQTMIVPNRNFITQNLTNWTRNDDVMRRKIQVGVKYGTDVEKVLKTLDEVVGSDQRVLADPPHRIWFNAFGDSGVEFEIWFFTRISDGFQTLTDLRTAIYNRFRDEGVEIPFPQRDLHVKTEDVDGLAGLLERRETTEL